MICINFYSYVKCLEKSQPLLCDLARKAVHVGYELLLS